MILVMVGCDYGGFRGSGGSGRVMVEFSVGQRVEMEKRNKIAQTQVLDLRNSTKTRNSCHIIIHAKTA